MDERRAYTPSLEGRKNQNKLPNTKPQDCNSLRKVYTLTFYFTVTEKNVRNISLKHLFLIMIVLETKHILLWS